ncbi:hypothetical protein COCON_G00174520 [Conger conger]|uniref:Uncharacterized protein n=1 Tax=Conger conger TaxID=82655 RepID=A0A9Q1D4A5_CONCO|nr:hypothetical protein COCON_G00174520 [Conger conger]
MLFLQGKSWLTYRTPVRDPHFLIWGLPPGVAHRTGTQLGPLLQTSFGPEHIQRPLWLQLADNNKLTGRPPQGQLTSLPAPEVPHKHPVPQQ